VRKGDRVFIQKNAGDFEYGTVGTVAEYTVGENIVLRIWDKYMPVSKNSVRISSEESLKKVIPQQLVCPNYWNGKPYMLYKDCNIGNLTLGDVGCIVGVNLGKNEEDDIFVLDFGFEENGEHKKISLDKKFMDTYMYYYDVDFENTYGEEVKIKKIDKENF
jgi:hypothetical protein